MTTKLKVTISQTQMDNFSNILIDENFEHTIKYAEGEKTADFIIKYYGENVVNFKMTITCLIKKLEK